jgi:transposase
MRYAQGGGLTDAGRAARERLRLRAVERFDAGAKNGEIAAELRVSGRSVERWRRAWRERGEAGVLSKGSPGRPRLSQAQIRRLERELGRGPLVPVTLAVTPGVGEELAQAVADAARHALSDYVRTRDVLAEPGVDAA